MNINKIKQQVIDTINFLKEKNIDPIGNNTYFTWQGAWFSKELWQVPSFQKLINDLFRDENINKFVSKRVIASSAVKFVIRNYNYEKSTEKILESIYEFNEFLNSRKEYYVYVPLKGIKMKINTIAINKLIRILHIEPQTIKNHINYSKEILIKSDNSTFFADIEPVMKKTGSEEEIVKALVPAAIEIKVQTAEYLKAIELANEATKILICFFRYIDCVTWDSDNLNVRYPGYGFLEEDLNFVVVGKNNTFLWNNTFESEEFEMDNDTLGDMREYGLNNIAKLLDNLLNHSLNERHQAILGSLILFGESRIEINEGIRLLKLMLAVECLLNTSKSDPVTITLSERLAFLIEDDVDKRIEVAKSFKKLYNQRSRVVHNGSTSVSEEDLKRLEYYVTELIRSFLVVDKWFYISENEQLARELDILKYSSVTSLNNTLL